MAKVFVSPKAKSDVLSIWTYISHELANVEAADRVVGKIAARIRGLKEHPQMGASVLDMRKLNQEYRYLVCDNYLVFYRYNEDSVYVTRVLHSRQNYIRILLHTEESEDE